MLIIIAHYRWQNFRHAYAILHYYLIIALADTLYVRYFRPCWALPAYFCRIEGIAPSMAIYSAMLASRAYVVRMPPKRTRGR